MKAHMIYLAWDIRCLEQLKVKLVSYLDRSSKRHISSQDLAGNQLHGFSWGLSRPTPPVRRNFHSSSSTSFLPFSKLTHNKSENSNYIEQKRNGVYLMIVWNYCTGITVNTNPTHTFGFLDGHSTHWAIEPTGVGSEFILFKRYGRL